MTEEKEKTIYSKTVEQNDLGMKVTYACTEEKTQQPTYAIQAYVSQGYKQPYKQFLDRKTYKYYRLEEFLEFCKKLYESLLSIFRKLIRF